MLTARFDDAFRYAHRLHQSQTRKGTSIPYISHLMTVSALVVEHGGNEDQAIAAVEDQGGSETLAKIRAVFGEAVAPTSRPLARWDCRFLSPVSAGRGFLRQKVRPRR